MKILKRIIAEVPYSEYALEARRHLAYHNENGKDIHDNALLFERLKPLLKYHFDSPSLLNLLFMTGMDSQPEAAIQYGIEALTNVDMYPMDSRYGAFPERIHENLGYAYQEIGHYSTALDHLNQALKLYNTHQDRTRESILSADRLKKHIIQIHKDNPILGPLSDGSASDLPERAPESSRVIIEE